jgi:uncharacterized protein (DUF2147 family)
MSTIYTKFLTTIIVACFTTFSQSDKIVGKWFTKEETSQVEIFKATDGTYCGKIIWTNGNNAIEDKNNPDTLLRKRNIIGLQILKNCSWSKNSNEWRGGEIYDPKSGTTYSCYLWFDSNNDLLKIKGYVMGIRLLGKTTTWTRVKETQR